MSSDSDPVLPVTSHRFLDEAGDTTFFGKGRIPIVGREDVSLSFSIGMVKFNGDLGEVRAQVRALQNEILEDRYLNVIPSIRKKCQGKGFYFHATDDPVADYLCWAVQRVFERGETRYYDFMGERISLVVDLYDSPSYPGNRHYHTRKNPLTSAKKLSPPSP